jgi:hypothetical protein
MIFAYGLILEELDMRIFKTYSYSPHFFLRLGQVPVAIALLWSVILAGAMAISDRLGLPGWARPFTDALLAVWLDLGLDAIAIRAGFWTWSIPLNEGWFGVPAGNLWAWMWVAFMYSAEARGWRRLVAARPAWIAGRLLLPVLAYAGLFVAMGAVGQAARLLGLLAQNQRLLVFWAQFALFAAVAAGLARPRPRRRSLEPPVARFAVAHARFLSRALCRARHGPHRAAARIDRRGPAGGRAAFFLLCPRFSAIMNSDAQSRPCQKRAGEPRI